MSKTQEYTWYPWLFFSPRPSPFFSLFSIVRPTQIFAFSKKKKRSYAEGNEDKYTLFQAIFTLIWNISDFLPYKFLAFSLISFDSNNDVDFSLLHCCHVNFVTTPCCFQAPWILCWGTGPPSFIQFSNFIFAFFFYFSDRPTQNQKTHSTINEKKRGWPKLFVIRYACKLIYKKKMLLYMRKKCPLKQFPPVMVH